MLPLTYCRKTVVKGGMVSHVGYHDTISVKLKMALSSTSLSKAGSFISLPEVSST